MRLHSCIKKRRIIKRIQVFAEMEILGSMLYMSMAVISTMEPVEQDLMTRLPELRAGGIAAIVGLSVWLAAGWHKHLEKRTKK